ncbi:hypothetical protein DVR12_17605 [Chitinophaga silvatica]|uniref:Uncharacterized protein n=1 Tax=Chitinophaga silvatica TaxID=2282649 RepID=A0A3E1Y7R6_9BACT|nr:hypothetical protein [Chitinophaga silvatica]RFS21151.1 hypothetical protein DVR12_17605 [Chitinophaga silvatica]
MKPYTPKFFLIVLFSLIVLNLFSCISPLSESKPSVFKTIKLPNKGYLLNVEIYPSDATIQGSVTVLAKYIDSTSVLGRFERYNQIFMDSVLGDSMIMLCLKDTNSSVIIADTIYLKLP